MFQRLVYVVKATLASLAITVNTLIGFTLMIPFALLKLVLPFRAVRQVADYALNKIADVWVANNGLWIAAVGHTRWQITGVENFKRQGWYLVSSNHQSWVDILVLQKVFSGHIPLLKFFIKKELIYVPIIGLAWWALDFPFMSRKGGKASAAKDLETARRACEKFRVVPTSVISFLEGTRFTPSKKDSQQSPYQHLLKPKTGGIGMALAVMGEQFDALLDVTIVYPKGVPTFTDLICGRLSDVIVDVRQIAIPPDLKTDTGRDPAYRTRLQTWVNGLWVEKDRRINELVASFKPR
ncbi:acyltransferase [Aquabacterium sp.]|uniref:acyltransferase n=1 Tax=Aquabacterium sp. TaxID=1872578 RepID=UPI002487A908|nr:acyltransferase [Aquabacterium sp.]MDI1259741.1 acyltransferase [Aquabacterium sp.]